MQECIQDTITQCRQLPIKDIFKFDLSMPVIGSVRGSSQYLTTIIDFVSLVGEVLVNSNGGDEIWTIYSRTADLTMDQLIRQNINVRRYHEMLWGALWQFRE